MLKLTLKPGEYIGIGDDVRIIFTGGSANNIHILVDAPKEIGIARSSAGGKKNSLYYKDKDISEDAKKEIAEILRRERKENGDAIHGNAFPKIRGISANSEPMRKSW